MCWGEIAVVAAGIQTGLQVAGQIQQGQVAAGQARYQEAVARNAAAVSEHAAQDALRRGEIAEARKRTETAQAIGQQRSLLAAQGFDSGDGSALDLLGDLAARGEHESLLIRGGAAYEAWQHRTRAAAQTGEAGSSAAAAGNATSLLRPAQTLLGGIESVSGRLEKARLPKPRQQSGSWEPLAG